MADPERPGPEEIARVAAEVFGTPVDRVTAPGGSSRESVRVHMGEATVIAAAAVEAFLQVDEGAWKISGKSDE